MYDIFKSERNVNREPYDDLEWVIGNSMWYQSEDRSFYRIKREEKKRR